MSDFIISTDKSLLNVSVIHRYLSGESYWAKGIPMEIVQRSVDHSLCFGVYYHDQQIGFARVVSDMATFAYLADVFILTEFRGKGLSKELMNYIMNYPGLQGLRRWLLATRDAHGLYQQHGFTKLSEPDVMMEIKNPTVYQNVDEATN